MATASSSPAPACASAPTGSSPPTWCSSRWLAISVIDSERQIIPNCIVYPTIFLSVPLLAVAALSRASATDLGQALLGATLALALALWVVYPAGMGFGDVRLAFVLGLFLGWISLAHVLVGMFLGVVLIAVVGVVLALLGSAAARSTSPSGRSSPPGRR